MSVSPVVLARQVASSLATSNGLCTYFSTSVVYNFIAETKVRI